jgi:hypothetical protein
MASRLRPLIEKHGFKFVEQSQVGGSLCCDFRRIISSDWHFLTLQFAKAGQSRFVLEAGKSLEAGDRQKLERMSISSIPMRARLQPHRGHGTHYWFRTDSIFSLLFAKPSFDRVCQQMELLFPQLDEWLRSGKIGKNIQVIDLTRAFEGMKSHVA